MTFISFLPNYKFVLVSCKIFGFLNFHVSHLNYETFKLCLQNTLNMSKTTKVYFGEGGGGGGGLQHLFLTIAIYVMFYYHKNRTKIKQTKQIKNIYQRTRL